MDGLEEDKPRTTGRYLDAWTGLGLNRPRANGAYKRNPIETRRILIVPMDKIGFSSMFMNRLVHWMVASPPMTTRASAPASRYSHNHMEVKKVE